MQTIYKSAGIIIENRKLLVERSQGWENFISPGGTREAGETDFECLQRELKEEVSIDINESDIEHFGTFTATAANDPDKQVLMQVYKIHTYRGTITPASEVEELKWVTSNDVGQVKLGSIFAHDVIPALKAANEID